MRSKPLLPALLLVGAGLSPLAQASSDDSCYPDWSLVGGGVCDTLPFLAPGNDTRANLRLLLADAGHWRLVEVPPSEEERSSKATAWYRSACSACCPATAASRPRRRRRARPRHRRLRQRPRRSPNWPGRWAPKRYRKRSPAPNSSRARAAAAAATTRTARWRFFARCVTPGWARRRPRPWPTAAWTCPVPAAGNKRNWAVCSRKASSRPQARPSPRTWRLRPTSTAVASTKPNRASRRCRTCRSPG